MVKLDREILNEGLNHLQRLDSQMSGLVKIEESHPSETKRQLGFNRTQFKKTVQPLDLIRQVVKRARQEKEEANRKDS